MINTNTPFFFIYKLKILTIKWRKESPSVVVFDFKLYNCESSVENHRQSCVEKMGLYDAQIPFLPAPAIPPPKAPLSIPALEYFDFPKLKGTYLCLYMCWICLFIVIKNNIQKYITKIGQKTGTSKMGKKHIKKAVHDPRKHVNQNLNSGNLLVNGLYSWSALVGNVGPSDGSSNGERNAIKLLRRKIPSPYATMKYPWTRYIRRKKIDKTARNASQRCSG